MQTYAPPRDPTAVMGKRIGAYIIDVILGWIVFAVLFAILSDSFTSGGFNPCSGPDAPSLCFDLGDTTYFAEGGNAAAIWLLPMVYWFATAIFMQGTTGSTPGKAIVGLKVIRRDTGEICGMGKAFVRSILWVVDSFPYCFPLVGLITGLSTDGHKRVGDMAANTAVVDKSDVGTPLDGAPAFAAGQQWAAPAAGGYAAPPPGGAGAVPPPGGYAPPPGGGFAATQPPSSSGDFGAPPPPSDFTAPTSTDYGAPPPPSGFPGADDATAGSDPMADFSPEPSGDFALPETEPEPFAAPEPEPYAAPEPPPAEPAPPVAAEPATMQSNQPPATTEPQWDAARNTYIQWDPVLAAWMQWDDTGQRWKHIDT